MNILITAALSSELTPIKKRIKQFKLPLKVDFFSTWMGIENTILNLTTYLTDKKYDFIINIGSCGYTQSNPDVIQIARIINLSTLKEKLVPLQIKLTKLWEIITVSQPLIKIETKQNQTIFVFKRNHIFTDKLDSTDTFIDMESYGFELVCEKFNIPRVILKIPTDKIGENFNYETYLNKINNIDFKTYLLEIKKFLETIPPQPDFEKYFKHFQFTFSQKEIFKKLYFKYQAIIDNFDVFFEKNKSLDRKAFLKILEQEIEANLPF